MSDEQKPPAPARRRPRRHGKPPRGDGNGAKPAAPSAEGQTAPATGGRGERQGGRGAGPRPEHGQRGERRGRGRGGKGGPRRDDRPQRAPATIRTMEGTVDRGGGFVITKRTDFDAAMHKPVSVRYLLTREGLPEPRSYARLAEAREAAQKPLEDLLPPPPPEPEAAAPEEGAPEKGAAEKGAAEEGGAEGEGDAPDAAEER